MEFPYGTITTDIPPEFVPAEAWPEYGYIASLAPICEREELGKPSSLRWSAWPLCFEQHIGDTEPDLSKFEQGKLAYNRFVMWRRIIRTDAPKGWVALSTKPPQIDGFKILGDEVTEGWHKKAKRNLRTWQEMHADKTHAIEPISMDEYAQAYRRSLVAKRIETERLEILKRKLTLPVVAEHAQLIGVRNLESGHIVAGTAILHSPTYKSSTHFVPFIHPEARTIFASTALIHFWFEQAQARGERFVVTTSFWFPGKPKKWKGFSLFKSHFGFQYIAYPPILWRFRLGKFW